MADEPLEVFPQSTFEETANILAAAFNGLGHQELSDAMNDPLAFLALGYITTYSTQVLHMVWSLPNGSVGPVNVASLQAYASPETSGWVQLSVARKGSGKAAATRRVLSLTYRQSELAKKGQYNPTEFSYRNIDGELVGIGRTKSPLLGNHAAHFDPENGRVDGDCVTTLRVNNDGLQYVMPYSGRLRPIDCIPVSFIHVKKGIIFTGNADGVHLKTPFEITFPQEIGFSPAQLNNALALVPR